MSNIQTQFTYTRKIFELATMTWKTNQKTTLRNNNEKKHTHTTKANSWKHNTYKKTHATTNNHIKCVETIRIKGTKIDTHITGGSTKQEQQTSITTKTKHEDNKNKKIKQRVSPQTRTTKARQTPAKKQESGIRNQWYQKTNKKRKTTNAPMQTR